MQRIVSLIPSATEIVGALGCEDRVVGRSHECDFPASIVNRPVCTEPKFPVDGSSREINQHVKGLLRDALSVYRVHPDILKRLQPDLIVTQTQCEVCAVSFQDVQKAMAEWTGSKPTIVSLQTTDLSGVWEDISKVAEATGQVKQGTELLHSLKSRMVAIANQARSISHHPTVGCIEWMDPLMASGNWMPELVTMAGGQDVFGIRGDHAPWITWEALKDADPEIIVVLPCGFSIQRTREELSSLTANPLWTTLRAVHAGHVYLTDGNQFFNRPGPRLVESLEILAEIFHPSEFRFGQEGKGWERM
ncbi:MAG: cobalamin-binding protein [Nitrospirota bacterium]|nr:MAG: cobalamin-binding protein [Nitrospirota bacterium]